ncbi:MAG TPA: hypothetical protein VHJ82_03470 [Actinomycetota bacterium]|nr:hypothetical protein [Actinomycetota bacterium]
MADRIGVVSLLIDFGRQLDSMITASSIENARAEVRDAEHRAELQAALETTAVSATKKVAVRG